MIEIIDAYTRSGHEWCTCCQKQDNTKRIKFSQDGRQGMSVVLCDDCRRELVRCLSESEDKEKLSWLGKNCKDCRNEKCKKLGTLPKGYDCALWQPKVENYSIKMVTNAKDAENYPISKGISKGIEEIKKMIFENGQAESEDT